MAGRNKLGCKDGVDRLTDYIYVSSLGIPVCKNTKPGLSRYIQSTHKSHIYCSRGDGRYTLCKYPPAKWQDPELESKKLPDCLTISKPAGINDIPGFNLRYVCIPNKVNENDSRFNEPLKHPKKFRTSSQVPKSHLGNGQDKGRNACHKCKRDTPACPVSAYERELTPLSSSHEASSTSLNEEAVYRAEADNQTATVAEELSGEDGVDEADKEIDAVEKKEKQCMDDLEEAIDMEKIVREAIACDNKLPDYEDILDAEGWRAQLPYDPFNVKPIKFRLPYYKKLPPQPTYGEQSNVHYKFNSPFFLNTIPALKYSFIIHPDFISESLEDRMRERRRQLQTE